MNTMTKMAAGAVLGGSMLVAGGFGLASAAPDAPVLPQPEAPQPVTGASLNVGLTVDGQQVGTIPNVSLTNAQTLATSVCPTDDLSAKLPQLASNEISTVPVCASSTTGVSYTFTTSGPGTSTVAPAQSNGTTGSATSGIGATATATPPAAETPMTGSR